MRWAIIDSRVYIDHWERGLHDAALEQCRREFVVRHSAVVLSELRRGARTPAALRLVEGLRRLARSLWEPTAADWWEAGKVIRTIGDARDWDQRRRQAFQNDALIALTARRHGATIVTANQDDFDQLRDRLSIAVRFV